MTKSALITGVAGQDGSYLAEYLSELGYKVFGIVRRNSVPEHQSSRIEHLTHTGKLEIFYGDLEDFSSLAQIIQATKPDEIYNLGAQSHVRISFELPILTTKINALGTLNLLECVRNFHPDAKLYQASSSEMFGNSVDEDNFQRITTPMKPVSPYGAAKLCAYNLCKIYRESYNLHICNGILFNHESPRRGNNFVTNKIIKGAVRIKLGLQNKLELGNLDSYRDWGHSKDYVKAMHLILNNEKPEDFIVSTMDTHSVRDLCKMTFDKLGLNYEDYVVQNPKYLRPNELNYLKGDSTPIREKFGWKPSYTFDQMVDEMINHWVQILSSSAN